MASIKVVLRKEEKQDGTHPLAIRITKDRKSSFIYLNYSIDPKYWDGVTQRVKKSHPNSARMNNFIIAKLAEANDNALTLEIQKENVTSQDVQRKIRPKGGPTFFAQANLYLENLKKCGNYNVYNSDAPRIKRFREFVGDRDITFSEVTLTLINQFGVYLIEKYQLKERTIINYQIVIRTILNQAIEAKLYDGQNYPFGKKGGISIVFPDSLKIGLSAKEVRTLETLDLSDSPKEDHARNVWLLSFYFAGIRAGDVLLLKRTDFQDDRLYYAMNKNDKPGSLKVPEKALTIIQKYVDKNYRHGLLFPELEKVDDLTDQYEVQRITSYADKNLNKYLKRVAERAKITKSLTMHISRHTFGNISGDKISLQLLQKLYRHSDIKTTIGYQQNFMHKDTDTALDAVVGF